MTSSVPRVTVGLPVFDGGAYLPTALDSLLGQTYADFELILADNGSSDATEEIARSYAARDARVRYLRSERNRGGAWNFNRVVAEARGPFFKWAAHDDVCRPRFVEACVAELDAHPAAVLCYPRTTIIDAAGRPLGEYEDELDLRSRDPVARYERYLSVYRRPHRCNPLFGLMRTELLRQTPLLGTYVSSDVILIGELALRGPIHELPEPLFERRDHPGASVRATPSFRARMAWYDPARADRLQLTRWIWLREHLSAIRRAPLSSAQRRACHALIARWMLWNARGLLKDGAKAAAWPLLRASDHARP